MAMNTGTVHAPFTPDQVDSLNGFQAQDYWHPFTCGNDLCRQRNRDGILIAMTGGWYCLFCPYTQGWAHSFMTDGSWKGYAGLVSAVLGVT
jgi:hypothetical protein